MSNLTADKTETKRARGKEANKTVYERFDEVMQEAADMQCPNGHRAIVEKLASLTEYLPQFPAIQAMSPTQHFTWCQKTLDTELFVSLDDRGQKIRGDIHDLAEQADYERAWKKCLWHIRRASGIGGSEIGTIVLNLSRDENGDFGSATNTVKEKLLMLAPQPGEKAMRRGHQMEDYVRMIHHRSSREVEDVNSLEALRGFRSKDHPFIIGTPDDITLRNVNGKRQRVLLDYKCPGEEVLEKYKEKGVPFGYVAQLHHYLIVAKDAGIKINALQLVPFDYKGGAETLIMPVEHDPELEKEINDTARMMWEEYVMQGKIPTPRKPPELKVESIEVSDAMRRAGVVKAISDELVKRAVEMRKEAIILADQSVDKKALGRMDSGFYYITRDAKWDEDTLLMLAGEADVDPDDFRKASTKEVNQKEAVAFMSKINDLLTASDPGRVKELLSTLREGTREVTKYELDLDALAKAVHDKGVDVSYAYVITEKAGLTQKSKGVEAEAKAIVMERAGDLVNEIMNVVETRLPDFMALEEEPEVEPDITSF